MAEHPSTEVVLCGGKRTPFGDFGKSLRDVVGTDLGIHAATATLDGVGLDAGFEAYPLLDPVVIGDVTGNAATKFRHNSTEIFS